MHTCIYIYTYAHSLGFNKCRSTTNSTLQRALEKKRNRRTKRSNEKTKRNRRTKRSKKSFLNEEGKEEENGEAKGKTY